MRRWPVFIIVDENHGWAIIPRNADSDRLLRTTDGGRSWQDLSPVVAP